MKTSIHELVEKARKGTLSRCIGLLESGWLVMGEVQPVDGYCLLLPDPVVPSLNDLNGFDRLTYCRDMIAVGDALLKVAGAYRINYETWGNLTPALHTHIVPRFRTESEDKRVLPICQAYDWKLARPFDLARDRDFMEKMRAELKIT